MAGRVKSVRLAGVIVAGVIAGAIALKFITLDTEKVLVASKDIPVGTKITADMFEQKLIHKDGKMPGVFIDDLVMRDEKTNELNAYASVFIAKSSQLTEAFITTPNSENNLNGSIKEGELAILLPVNENNGLSRSLNAGDKVSILGTVKTDVQDAVVGSKTIEDTIVMAENAPIIRVEKENEGDQVRTVGYIISVPAQVAVDIHHILSTEDDQNRSAIRVVLSGYNNPDPFIPKSPIGDLKSRYIQSGK